MATLIITLAAATMSAGCVSGVSRLDVLRVEYTGEPDAQGHVESGVIFWRPKPIAREEIPADLLEKLGSTYPIIFQLEEKLANTCFVTNSEFGLTLLEHGKTELRGPLWLTVDAAWWIEVFLAPDGAIRGKTGYSFGTAKSNDATTLKGSHRKVADFAECFEKVRVAPSQPGI